MKLSGFIVVAVFAALTFGLWAYFNQPVSEPPWPDRVQGVAFSPFRAGQDPAVQSLPSDADIDADLALLANRVTAVRTYSALKSLGQIAPLAERHGLKVTQGVWLDTQLATNEREIAAAIELAQRHSNIIRVIVGNEVLLRGNLSREELAAHLERVRAEVDQPVSTAEPWHVWLKHPELAQHVDFIAVHLLPYWEGVGLEQSMVYIAQHMRELQAAFPGKPIVIAEAGWPSDGRTRGSAVASVSNQALFLRRFLALAQRERYVYYLMEAFDQPWKARYEGAVGAYWGIYDVARAPKFELIEPIVRVRGWQRLAMISVAIAALLLGLFYAHSSAVGTRARSLLALVTFTAATGAVWIVYDYSQRYQTFASVLIGMLLLVGTLVVAAVLLAEAHEWVEARWGVRHRRFAPPERTAEVWPTVSIHVPAYNEPPQMLIETLEALAALDYPSFEVIVIDNNTPDESAWRPVERRCASLGGRFRFYHVDPLPGFKAGALNFALARTNPDASIVAIIDSDYKVEPQWLRDLVPAFDAPRTAIVQAPQDYRDAHESLFKAMCHAEYRGFFHIGMVTRNERNAIIQHGTMTLVRRQALEAAGGWAEWCITEDAELGLRLFEHGHEAQYLPRSYGYGLMPETFADYKKQRFRWAYGAMQILRAHARPLLSPADGRLTRGQRYHFIAGWLPWLADGLNLLFNVAALAWSIAMIVAPNRIDPPLIMFAVLPLSLFTFRLVKLMHLYMTRVGATVRQTLAAAIAGLALSHTVGVAIVKGAFTRHQPFVRTPKHKQPDAIAKGLSAVRAESFMLMALTLCAICLSRQIHLGSLVIGLPEELKGPDVSVWVAMLLIQAVPFAAAILVSFASALGLPAAWIGQTRTPARNSLVTRA